MKKVKEETIDSPTQFTAESLQKLDASLRCQICREHFRAPVITKCSHSFCSICFGEYYNQHRRCPTCSVELNVGANRKNSQLEEIVLLWSESRPTLLSLESSQASAVASTSKTPTNHRSTSNPSSSSRVRHSNPSSGHASSADEAPPRTRSRVARQDLGKGKGKGKGTKKSGENAGEGDSSDIEIIEVSGEVKPSRKGKGNNLQDPEMEVTCPNCSGIFKNKLLFAHTTKCLSGALPKHKQPALHGMFQLTGSSSTKTSTRSTKATPPPDKPLPLTNYAGMTAAKLASILKEQGLPTTTHSPSDDKVAVYTRRHEHWVLLWNSNCLYKPDNPNRKTKGELIKELLKWEDTRRFKPPVVDSEQHLSKYGSEFQKMISDMKKRGAVVQPPPVPQSTVVEAESTTLPSEGEDADVEEMDATNEMEELAAEAAAADLSQTSRRSPTPSSPASSPDEFPMLPPPRPSAVALGKKREREPSPFDENGPRPSQRERIMPVEEDEEDEQDEEGEVTDGESLRLNLGDMSADST